MLEVNFEIDITFLLEYNSKVQDMGVRQILCNNSMLFIEIPAPINDRL
jgi:hypothetical protein